MADLNIHISDDAQAFAAAEAARRGLPDAAAYAAALLEDAAHRSGTAASTASFYGPVLDLDALAREQGVKPITDISELAGDFWPEDESVDEFIAAVRSWRDAPPTSPHGGA